MNTVATIESIDAWLPQTQCAQCGYPRCRDYAGAIATGKADINQCPPGGEVTIRALAALMDLPVKSLNPANGEHKPRVLAVIREEECIGCTKCIRACPVDAILGAAKLMHTVIGAECTGCELCLPPCPVDCIDLLPYHPAVPYDDWPWPEYSRTEVERARKRIAFRLARLSARKTAQQKQTGQKKQNRSVSKTSAEIKQEINAAVARVRAKKAKQHGTG